jgi:hypothetical protein
MKYSVLFLYQQIISDFDSTYHDYLITTEEVETMLFENNH